MVFHQKKVRALGLSSGGLDSILSALVLREQGIDVAWVSFETPFFSSDKARKASESTGIPLTVRNITPIYVEMLRDPRCGYGQHMNPCLDCHALMFQLAGEMLQAAGFDFLFSGEVVGQRPMSQTRSSLRYVEKKSGFEGYILRPLSAQRLPETIPEINGWIRREALHGIAGRSRKPQIALAKRFNVSDYPNPAGGCLLTEKNYCARLQDLFDHAETCTEAELHLLKHGRHLRISPRTKIVTGRDQKDNEAIIRRYDPDKDTLIRTVHIPGPVVLVCGPASRDEVLAAASICIGYSSAPRHAAQEVNVIRPEGAETLRCEGLPQDEMRPWIITEAGGAFSSPKSFLLDLIGLIP
ncbi:tRNA 4-thiouridine(8) synthase ThiI [Desulfococcus sp.]|uniref:tRNA 4-thiouridine(8) synthase ThiI n=1 Tax=Desulfococcus sp. TaxID=2025834 RepID=UPI003593A597